MSDEVFQYDAEKCPLTAALRVIGSKWKGIIWWRLSKGIGRFGALQRSLPQISQKVLTAELRQLQEHGIVARTAHSEVPPRVEYSLTEYGRSLAPVVDLLCSWGSDHLKRRCVNTPTVSDSPDGAAPAPSGHADDVVHE